MCETVLIVADNDSQSQQLEGTLHDRLNYEVVKASGKESALSLLIADQQVQPDLVVVDMTHSETQGLDILHSLRMCKPQLPIIMLMEKGSDKTMSHAFELGVNDIIMKPFWPEQLRLAVSNVISMQRMTQYISYLERRHEGKLSLDDMMGTSEPMRHVRHMGYQASQNDQAVWLTGEAGTGREMLAIAIHGASRRAGRPLVTVDCLSLEDGETDYVLMGGTVPGKEHREGKIAEAADGTIVLKNIGVLTIAMQQKLQDVITGGVITPVGGGQSKPCRARFILINTDINDSRMAFQTLPIPALKALCPVTIALPPLRERTEDVAMLANHFARMYAASENKKIRYISDAALEHLTQQPWPGNVRELMHVIWRAVLLSSHECIEVGDIRLIQQLQPVHYENRQDSIANRINPLLLDTQGNMKNLEAIEKEVIQFALTYSGGCMTHAAKNLGIGRSTLYRRMSALKLENHISRENQMTRPTIRISSKTHS
jgi:DNA-binding NtrC family response regulator